MRIRILTTIKQRIIGDTLALVNDIAQESRVTSTGQDDRNVPVAIWRIPAGSVIEVSSIVGYYLVGLGHAEIDYGPDVKPRGR